MRTGQPKLYHYLKPEGIHQDRPTILPILFCEKGSMPREKGGQKKCTIIVDPSGMYFYRPKEDKPKLFVSVYDITEICYCDPKRRDIQKSDNSSTYFICDHADDAVRCLVCARRALYYDISDPSPIRLKSFPTEPSIPPENTLAGEFTVSQLRYACLSLQYRRMPDPSLLGAMRKMVATNSRTFVLDESVAGPDILASVVTPICLCNRVEIIVFKGYAPYVVCRIAHFLLKKSKSISTIIFDGYNTMMPSQLRMKTVK